MCNLENIQLTDTAKPMDYDAYWKRWLKVCIEGIIKERTEREQTSVISCTTLLTKNTMCLV
jgi:gluconate kinase